MINKLAVSAALLVATTLLPQTEAATFDFGFVGTGVSGTVQLTYGTGTDAKYPQAFEVTGISGTFSDSNSGLSIVDAPISSLVPIRRDSPEPTNLLAPNDFSRFAVAGGTPALDGASQSLNYSNLFYPGGSPQTASDYPFHGGFLDIYGLMFNIGGGRVVNLWSNGDFTGSGSGPVAYGVAVATSQTTFDYVGDDVSVTPEPGTLCLLGSGLAGLLVWRRRALRERSH